MKTSEWLVAAMSLGALVFAALAWSAGGSATPQPDLTDLGARLLRLEAMAEAGRWAATPGRREMAPDAPAVEESPPERAPVRTRLTDAGARLANDVANDVAELQRRVARLEERSGGPAQGMAKPDAMMGRLAVLLASRGVITKVGDVEAIQDNMPTLAALVGDETAAAWDRLEAYRGMLIHGFESPQLCTDSLTDVAAILMAAQDPKVRLTAAGLMGSYRNPAVAGPLLAVHEREQNGEVREQVVIAMIQLIDDPDVRRALETGLERESAESQKRIRTALRR